MQPTTPSTPALRRFALYGLILLALALVSAVIFVVATDEPILADEDAFPPVVILDPEKRPRFDFPEAARTYDLSLNQFIDRFARVCMEGRYTDFRLMLSRRRPPILPARFESNFNALKNVRILGIEKAPLRAANAPPVYIMKAEYELKDFAVRQGQRIRQVQVALVQEDGEWRMGPIPRDAAEKLAGRDGAATPPPIADPTTPKPSAPPPTKPRAMANQPARIGR